MLALPTFVIEAMKQDGASIDLALLQKYQRIVGALLYGATNTVYSSVLTLRTVQLYTVGATLTGYETSSRPLHGYSDSNWALERRTQGPRHFDHAPAQIVDNHAAHAANP